MDEMSDSISTKMIFNAFNQLNSINLALPKDKNGFYTD